MRSWVTGASSSNRARRCSSAASRGAEPRGEQRRRRLRRARRACRSRARAAARPSSGRSPAPARTARRRTGARLLARQHDEPARLLGVGGDLRDELARPDPDRAAEGRSRRSISIDDPAHRRVRRGQPRQLEVRLVEPDHLDRLDVRRGRSPSPRARPRGSRRSPAPGTRRPGTAAAPAPPASPSRRRTAAPRTRRS